MYINEVVSYLGAWDNLKENHPSLLKELEQVCENFHFNLDKYYLKQEKVPNVYPLVRDFFQNELLSFNWVDERHINYSFENSGSAINLGLGKDSCFIRIASSSVTFQTMLMSWIYNDIELANKSRHVSVPILLVLDFSPQDFLENNSITNTTSRLRENRKGLRFIKRRLERISPLKFEYPFLILGVGLDKNKINLVEIEHEDLNKNNPNIKIDRCITFEPEYYQAGLGILNYFGTILRDKYPDQNVTVKIEQHDLTVRMIIETEDGNIETLEKALHEYELVLKGQKSAEEFYLSPIKALELKNQLNIFKFQVDSQKEIIALQRGQILSLEDIVDKALAPITHPPVTIINQLNNTQSMNINHQTELNESYDDLDKLIDIIDNDSLKKRLERALTALDAAQNLD